MKALTFAQEFALIALNAQDSLHMTTVKKIAVRCMAAAAILEWAMEEDGLQRDVYKRQGQTRAVSPRTENRLQDYSHFPYLFPVKSRCGALHCGGFFLLFKVSFC